MEGVVVGNSCLALRGGPARRKVYALCIPVCVFAFMAAGFPAQAASESGVVISEVQLRGPEGGNDEFVELTNASGEAADISGYALEGCAAASGAPSNRATVPEDTTLGPGDSFLFTNDNASGGYSGEVEGDQSYGVGISDTGGARLVDDTGAPVDGVASADGEDECREGEGLDFPAADGSENAFERADNGTRDAGDNASDFEGPQAAMPENLSSAPVPIHDIQGDGASSPLEGENVTVEGVVTGVDDEIGADYERTYPEDAGIFIQETEPDGDPDTSEGIFIGYARDRNAYEPGDVVRTRGEVKEKFGLTMISEEQDREPEIVGSTTIPEPVEIEPERAAAQSEDSRGYYESLENMRVRLATGTANSGGTDGFGELFLTPGTERDRVFRTGEAPALLATDADAGANDPDNPYDAPPSQTLVRADLFDRVDDVVGPLAYSFDDYKIMVQEGRLPEVTDGPTNHSYDDLPEKREGQLRFATFNVENFFDDVDDTGKDDAADLEDEPISAEEYEAKKARLADAIDRLMRRPKVIAVQEVEKKEILDELAADLGGYEAYLKEGNDSRGIDNGFLVKDTVEASNVRQLGKDAENPTSADCSDEDGLLFDRPPLAIDIASEGRPEFTAFSNHFSSKGSPDECREAQAEFVRGEVKEIEAAGGEAIVAGDLNAFEDESALRTMEDGTTSLDNLWDEAPAENRYSFQFSGKLQTLDHILVTGGLAPAVEDFRYAHFDNDYHERGDAGETGDGHSVSDHDPAVLTLGAGQQWTDPVTDGDTAFHADSESGEIRFTSGDFDTGVLQDPRMKSTPGSVHGNLQTDELRLRYNIPQRGNAPARVDVRDLENGERYRLSARPKRGAGT